MADVNATIDVVITGAEQLNAIVRKLRQANNLADDIRGPDAKIAADVASFALGNLLASILMSILLFVLLFIYFFVLFVLVVLIEIEI